MSLCWSVCEKLKLSLATWLTVRSASQEGLLANEQRDRNINSRSLQVVGQYMYVMQPEVSRWEFKDHGDRSSQAWGNLVNHFS